MILFLEILVVVILLTIAVRSATRAFSRRYVSSADLICSVLFIFYGLPLVYDWILPAYSLPWFAEAATSPRVAVGYCVVILAAVSLIKLGAYQRRWRQPGRPASGDTPLPREHPTVLVPLVIMGAWAVLFLPLLAVLVSGTTETFLTYGGVVQLKPSTAAVENLTIGTVHMICLVAVMGFFLIDWLRVRQTRSGVDLVRWVAFAFAVIAVYIHGKRALAFALVMVVIMVRFLEGRLRLRTCVILGAVLIVGSYAYLGQIKGTEVSPFEFVRGDLARDYTLRHVLYRSDWTQSPIVPYRGASYIFFVTAYVPRALWPAKPWTAPVYLTNDVFNRREGKHLSWGFGLGFIEELIMNFGYLGILGCLLIGRLCAWVDRRIYGRSSFYGVLWIPMVFSCAFASSVVLGLVIVVVVPALLLRPVFARRTAYSTITASSSMRAPLRRALDRQRFR